MVVGGPELCRWYSGEYLGEYTRGYFLNPSPDKRIFIKDYHNGITVVHTYQFVQSIYNCSQILADSRIFIGKSCSPVNYFMHSLVGEHITNWSHKHLKV